MSCIWVPVAQLEERLPDTQEDVGSNPSRHIFALCI